MDLSYATKYKNLSVSEKVQLVMMYASRPLHYLDVDELILSIFGVKHSSYSHLNSGSEYVKLTKAVYIHKALATADLYKELKAANDHILSYIEEIVEYAKIPVPNNCFAAYLTTTEFQHLLTNRTARSYITKSQEDHPFLYRTVGLAIASRNILFDSHLILFTAKEFNCDNCALEKTIPLSDLVTQNFKSAQLPFDKPSSNTPPKAVRSPIPSKPVAPLKSVASLKPVIAPGPELIKSPSRPVAIKSPEHSPLRATEANHRGNTVGSIIFCDQNNQLSRPLAKYEDLDEAMIDAFFIEVLNSSDPTEVIPTNLYETWKATLSDSPFAKCPVTEVASEMDLTWPVIRHDELISDFLKYGITEIKGLVSFGRKKTRTLILCIAYSAYKANKAKFTSYSTTEHPALTTLTTVATLPTQAPQITLKELLQLDRPELKINSEQWDQWCASIENSPVRTIRISEVAYKCRLEWPYSKREERITGYLKHSLNRLKNLPGFGPKKLRTLVLCIASLGLEPPSIELEIAPNLTSTNSSPSQNILSIDMLVDMVRETIYELPPREKLIIESRYGIPSGKSLTLEEIANHTSLTRERVRQILKEVYERIKFTSLGKQLPILIEKLDTDELWERLSNAYGVIQKGDITRAFERQFNGEFVFALECCGINIPSWLSSIAIEHSSAWYRSSASPDEIRSLIRKLDDLFTDMKLPLPLAALSDYLETSLSVLGTAICLLPDYIIYEGYAIQGRITPRTRRTVHLHQLLTSEGTHLSLCELTSWHNTQHPDETCSTRDADIVMREAQHLFVSLGDQGWCSIGHYSAGDESFFEQKGCKPEPDIITATDADEDTSVASLLKTILRNRGFVNFTDIIADFKRVPGNTLSEHSVGPILFTRDEFAKFAPSVYGLSEKLNGIANISSELLLNDYDCQIYTMARYAGEEFYSYPLWTPSMEYLWCDWVQHNANQELRESLYYISTPDEWPINDKLIRPWKNKIEEEAGSYYFLREPKYTDSNLPDIRSLYALMRYAVDTGSLSWISANRVLSRRIDDYHTAIEMALLVCFGIIDSSYNWQKRHNTKSDADDICRQLSALLPYEQDCSWDGKAGEFLLDIFTLNITTQDMGWVSVSEINKLFHIAPSKNTNASTFGAYARINTDHELGGSFLTRSMPSEEIISPILQQNASILPPPNHSPSVGPADAYDDLLFLMDDDDAIILS